MALEILKFSMSGGFWHFVGCLILLVTPLSITLAIVSEVLEILTNKFKTKA